MMGRAHKKQFPTLCIRNRYGRKKTEDRARWQGMGRMRLIFVIYMDMEARLGLSNILFRCDE